MDIIDISQFILLQHTHQFNELILDAGHIFLLDLCTYFFNSQFLIYKKHFCFHSQYLFKHQIHLIQKKKKFNLDILLILILLI